MINAKEEFIFHVKNKTVISAIITDYKVQFRVNIKSKTKNIILRHNFVKEDWNSFTSALDFEYDNSDRKYQQVFGYIWYDDESWSERDTYAGYSDEWWAHKSKPTMINILLNLK